MQLFTSTIRSTQADSSTSTTIYSAKHMFVTTQADKTHFENGFEKQAYKA